jgi:hypothetical protein
MLTRVRDASLPADLAADPDTACFPKHVDSPYGRLVHS